MKTKIVSAVLVFITGMVWAGAAYPAAVLGLSINDSSYVDYSDVEVGFGGKAYFGYHFETVPFLVELGYLDLGDHEIQNFPADLSFVGGQAVLGVIPFRTKSRHLTTWLKGGYYSGNAELRFSGSSTVRERTTGGSFEIGVGWMFKPWLGLRAEIGALFDVEDFADKSDIVMLNIGLTTSFPGYTTRARPADGRPPVTPPAPDLATILPPPEEPLASIPDLPSPPPSPPPPARFVAGETALAMPGATLRSRPAADGQIVTQLGSGVSLVLKSDMKNIAGAWWYVEAPGQRGWVKESELQPKLP